MNAVWPIIALAGGATVAALTSAWLLKRPPHALVRRNYRGERVPVVLGRALAAGVLVGGATPTVTSHVGIAVLAAVLVMHAVGALDDVAIGEERGFREHLGSLRRLRVTTGVLKLAAGVGAGVVLAVLLGGGTWRVMAAAVTIAAATNLWNALDVRPGRALKIGILALVPLVVTSWYPGYGVVGGAALGAALAVLPFDLGERGMLGDAGSNPLGLVVGLGLALVLPTGGLIAAGGVLVALQVVAETVTISRLIDAVPPLRWFDRLGRRPEGQVSRSP